MARDPESAGTNAPWFESYPEEVPRTFEYPDIGVPELLLKTAADYPKHTAVDFMGYTLRYADLLDRAYRFANALVRLGVRKGDRVAIMLPNTPQCVIAFFGTLLAGGVAVMTNPLYVENELRHQLQDSGATVIVTLDLLAARVAAVVPDTAVRHTIVTSIKDALPFPKNVLYPLTLRKSGGLPRVAYSASVHAFKAMIGSASSARIETRVNPASDVAVLQYTGGTTGVAKGVMLTHRNVVANTMQCRLWFTRVEEGKEVYLAVAPMFHVFGLTVALLQSVHTAGKLVLVPRFNPIQVLQLVHKHRVTVFPGTPTIYTGLLNHPAVGRYDLSSIKACISGSAPLPLELQEAFEAATGGRLIEGYGLTEASPVTHANPVWGKRKIGTIGLPLTDTHAKIVDGETMAEKATGEIGELAISGPQVMAGYWGRPDETAAVLKNGWLLTGDMASMDDEGYFRILDRKKDLILAGGFNIYPREVEEALYEHPAVLEAVAVGVPDPYRGETVKAFLVLKEGAAVTEPELDEWCRVRLAAFKVPRLYEFRDALPKTIVGKVLRRKLLEEHLRDRQPDRMQEGDSEREPARDPAREPKEDGADGEGEAKDG